ncbi:MAG: two-component sensor histidine kinase, partial [Desulfomonile tiedjei]|nr:two-component sensor histidine kinase [Desulfomonile tiedjei]
GIAHEIRNPLASINFNVQMLSKKVSGDATLSELIDDTIQGIDKIKILVKSILDFAKPKAPMLKRGRLLDIVTDSVALMKPQISKANVTVRIDLSRDVPEIVFDPHQIQQVFINLILNALEAMPDGGAVEVRTETEENAGNDKPQLAVSVADDGCGIPHEIQPRIFDPFFTTKTEGTGLGLSIVHKIMEQHDATIDCISEVHKGTTFILRFPLETELLR